LPKHPPEIPKCVADTIPDSIKDELGTPPTKKQLVAGLEAMFDDFNFISSVALAKNNDSDIKMEETLLIDHMELLYDFVYYRNCDMEKVFDYEELGDFIGEIWSGEITTAVSGLFWLLNTVRYQSFTKAGEGLGPRSIVFDAAVHFIQLAHIQSRLEFGNDGAYVADKTLLKKLYRNGISRALFTNQEIEFIASVTGQSVSNELRDEGLLEKVASTHVVHWAKYSNVPDYLNPRMGNEIGNKQSFITLPSLQSWLARKPGFLPTQFIYHDEIPEYTAPDFFKLTYLTPINELKISGQTLQKLFGFNEIHLKWLKKGKRGLFFRQALLLDNYIYQQTSDETNRECFPTYHAQN
jgi:hypothetical protein